MMMSKKLGAILLGIVLVTTAAGTGAAATGGSGGYGGITNKVSVRYEVAAETQGWPLDGSYRITTSGHKVGSWGAYDGWKITPAAGAAMRYDFIGEEGTARIAQFYTMLSNFTKGLVKTTFHVKKLGDCELLDLGIKFYDVARGGNVGSTDLTAQYNAAPAGQTAELTAYIDLSYIGSIDSFIVWAKADTAAAQFLIDSITFEWGKTAIATADGYFRGLESGYRIAFHKMARFGEGKEYVNMPITGYSSEYGNGYDSGRHGDYGFNHASIKVHNDEEGEYLSVSKGTDNAVGGIWLKFPLDVTRKKVNLRFTVRKKEAGDCAELKFEFCSKSEDENVAVTIGNEHSFTGIPQLNDMEAGSWQTYDIANIDVESVEEFDSLGIWIDAGGAEEQALQLKDVSLYYDACGPAREQALTPDDKSVNGLTFESWEGVTVKSDRESREYLELAYALAPGNTVRADYAASGLTNGKYRAVVTFRKPCALDSDFTLVLSGVRGGADIGGGIDFSAEVRSANEDVWTTAESNPFEMKDAALADSFRLITSSNGAADKLEIESVSFVQTEEYVDEELNFGVSGIITRDFRAMDALGVDEYDFSQNGFPEIGNWSDSFPDLRSQGQKVVRDTDGVPVMKVYRRTPAEIKNAKEQFNWPEGTDYMPADQSHFFMTAPHSPGYLELKITVKKGENFKGTADFSLEGYMGTEPWWKLADFTASLAAANTGEWITLSQKIYLPKDIDSIKIRVETRYEDSDLYIKNLQSVRKQNAADGYFEANRGGDLSWDLLTEGAAIDSVKLDGKALPESSFTATAERFVLSESYLKTLSNGNYLFTLSSGAGEIGITVYVSKVSPVAHSQNVEVNLLSLKELTLNVDYKNSALKSIELNGTQLIADAQYTFDSDAGTLTLLPAAFNGLEVGEATLLVKTGAGQTEIKLRIVSSGGGNTGLIIGLSVGGGAALLLGLAAVLIIRNKKRAAR